MPSAEISGTALFSHDRKLRFLLTRSWSGCYAPTNRGLFAMLNPSDAGEEKNDMTVRKCIGFSKRWGFSGMAVVNLTPEVSTDPWLLSSWSGYYLENEDAWSAAIKLYSPIIVAWGSIPRAIARRTAITEHMGRFYERVGVRPVFCIGTTKRGDPLHPSRAAYTSMYERFEP